MTGFSSIGCRSPGNIVVNVSSDLEGLTTSYPEGFVIFADDVKDEWRLSRYSTTLADGITTINSYESASGTLPGRWVRMCVPHPDWKVQFGWYIDPVAGNDYATGTSGDPIKTWAELLRRTSDGFAPGSTVTVYLLDDLPEADPLNLDWRFITPATVSGGGISGFSTLMVEGSVKSTLLSTGTVSGFTERDPSVNSADELTATDGIDPVDWANLLSTHPEARIRFTSGSASGAVCYAVKDLGGGIARITRPWDPMSFVPISSANMPVPGDTFVIETLIKVSAVMSSKAGFNQVIVSNVWFDNGQYAYVDAGSTGAFSLFFIQCVANGFNTLSLWAFNCLSYSYVSLGSVGSALFSGGVVGYPVKNGAGTLQLDQGVIIQGSQIGISTVGFGLNTYGTCYIYDVGIFDSPTSGVEVQGSGQLQIVNGSTFYGNGNANFGVLLGRGSRILGIQDSSSTTLKITGTSGDVKVGTLSSKAWTDALPWLDSNSFAGVV